ncbi:Decapping and exoribonuclease protein [Portunus trituberculatus]|uniref:Decapping nuclease n=1 Tax=Portunus trituberculatus TaxID=210409 RepID=A0A5B7DFN6_PORTR|nr:Decapping and exoribonuclease protein [Portunus trituberculatus]
MMRQDSRRVTNEPRSAQLHWHPVAPCAKTVSFCARCLGVLRGAAGEEGVVHGVVLKLTSLRLSWLMVRNHLMVRSTGLYQGGPRSLGVPNVLGSYTIDSELKVQFNDSMMSVLSKEYIPQDNECLQASLSSNTVELDLNRGWHRVNGYTGTTAETYRQLLQWILKNQKRLKAEDSSNKLLADFVCSRGVLKNIMLAPYAGFVNMDISVLAQCFKGTIYLTYQHEAQEDQKDKEKSSLLEIYGHKFEQYMRGGDPDQVLECNCQFRCVVKQHVNELSLMYSMNTHGTDQAHHKENFTDMSSFVLLRALKECTEPFKQRNYRRFTLCKWWSESQLSGIPRVLKGTRSQDGIVHTLEMLQAADLPDLAEVRLLYTHVLPLQGLG